jgi:alpha-tubulin suppressor-like RCC1 family protein
MHRPLARSLQAFSLATLLIGCGAESASPAVEQTHAALARRTARHDTLAAGEAHSCALEADGTVVCWGSNTAVNDSLSSESE